jgi:hypothetical protein
MSVHWKNRSGLLGALVVVVLLAVSQPATAFCPGCWVKDVFEEGIDYVWDDIKGIADLTWDILTLDPKEAWEDFNNIAYNHICLGFTALSLAVSAGLEADFDECASPPQPIAPDILSKLRLYFKSPFNTVQIHEGCNLNADLIPGDDSSYRSAITFGDNIYFEPGAYRPQEPKGFAVLAHELTHVLQYRKKGFADFMCEYGLNCRFGLNRSCAIEQEAEKFEALVLEDRQRPDKGDGVLTPVDNCPDAFNPDQADSDQDGIGNACDSYAGGYGYGGCEQPPETTCPEGQGWIYRDCQCGCSYRSSCNPHIGTFWDEATCSCKDG